MNLKLKNFIIVLLGSMIQAFGIRNIHAVAEITEGGALGLELLLNHWFNISPPSPALLSLRSSGDDALAMSLSRRLNIDIRWIYLTSDLVVLALSLTYIPPLKIFYSLITVFLSGKIISLVAGRKINPEFKK